MKETFMTQPTNPEHDLEDHIELLRKLDVVRKRSAQLRDEGIEVLAEYLRFPEKKEKDGDQLYQIPLVLRALLTRHEQPFAKQKEEEKRLDLIKDLIEQLQKNEKDGLTLEKLAENELSVLVAANILRVLSAMPGAVFSKTAMLCYYWIIRELYTADRSDWNIGGARAAPGGLVTAFTTGECIRALLSFADALRNTGEFVVEVGNYLERTRQLDRLNNDYFGNAGKPLNAWEKAEKARACLSCSLKLQALSRCLALPLIPLDIVNPEIDNPDIEKITLDFKEKLFNETVKAIKEFKASLTNIQKYRDDCNTDEHGENAENIRKDLNKYLYDELSDELPELSLSQKQRFKDISRSESAHLFAVLAVTQSLDRVKKVKSLFDQGDKEILKKIKREFDEAADEIPKLLHPVKNYLSSVVDRELTLVSLGEQWDWQPGELACAAASYGKLTEGWEKDARFGRAVGGLSKMVSSRGRFANPRHFHEQTDGIRHITENAVILRAMAQLLHHTCDSEIEIGLADNMLHFFEDTRARQAFDVSSDKKGWVWEFSQPPLKTDLAATASAVMALGKINEMLDAHINHIILEHFTVKEKGKKLDAGLTLDSLFYPDYGLRLAYDADTLKNLSHPEIKDKDWPKNGIQRQDSIAIALQRMRAHVSRLSLPKDETLCSLVLHGPAGTGKTTLVEALAVSCGVPLVEVTPSDLVKYGEEDIEQRARAVFEALSMLTRAVILFDEFDPVLKRREVGSNNALNVFSFLTPGMLPKLKDLHNGAEKRSVAYVLVTNLIGELDEAAVRQGRFDERLGIYPPDLLSRSGRFLDQIYKDFIDEASKKFKTEDVPWNRIVTIIEQTAGKGMTTLGKPGWFTVHHKKRKELKEKRGTPYHFLHLKKKGTGEDTEELRKTASLEWPEPDDELKGIRGEGKTAVTECLQWMWISAWDEELSLSEKRSPDTPINNLLGALNIGKVSLNKGLLLYTQTSPDKWEVRVGRNDSFEPRMLIQRSRYHAEKKSQDSSEPDSSEPDQG